MDELSDSDRAALRFVGEIPDGEYNRKVEAIATNEGIEIDNYIVIPWGWVFTAIEHLEKNSIARSEQSPVTPRLSPEHEP